MATSTGLAVFGEESELKFIPDLDGRELMAVTFKDDNTIVAGERSGCIHFYDSRSAASVLRMRHRDSVAHIRTMADPELLLVNGLRRMSIYDLRNTPIPQKVQKGKQGQWTHISKSTAFLEFHIPQEMRADRYGLGFAYSAELGLVARASSQPTGKNKVTLYSSKTGRIIDCRLTRHDFKEPVTCIDIRRVRDGPESVFIASGGEILEWTCMGLEENVHT